MDTTEPDRRGWNEFRPAWRQVNSEGRTWLGVTLVRQSLGVRPGILAGVDPPIGDEPINFRPPRKAGMDV